MDIETYEQAQAEFERKYLSYYDALYANLKEYDKPSDVDNGDKLIRVAGYIRAHMENDLYTSDREVAALWLTFVDYMNGR